MNRFANVWLSALDPLDGFFVEVIERRGKLECQIHANWFPTIEICEDWAARKGALAIYEK